MALPLNPRLVDVRSSVGIRLKYGPDADLSDDQRQVIDEYIRQAFRQLIVDAYWVELRVREEITLENGQSTYDFPDRMDPGRIEQLIVKDSDGGEMPLRAGIRSHEREQFTSGSSPESLPLRYEFVNQTITILPPPDTSKYPTLLIEGYERGVAPYADHDRIPVDEEAIIQMATVIGMKDMGHPDAQLRQADLDEFLKRLRPMQSDGESIQIGGHFSEKFRYKRARRIGDRRRDLGNNYWLLGE